ncbi:MAG: GIY-YIG nuclease family protein [Candidatus Diapherotrites archaeon]|nr:GIY-YIG nuclease family protein [Candidatus Diapherotrites archaeon]
MAFVYLLECRDGTYYCGWTNDLNKRVAAHNAGSASKYTRSRTPVRLVYSKRLPDRNAAMRLEYRLKRMTRAQKKALIAGKKTRIPQ